MKLCISPMGRNNTFRPYHWSTDLQPGLLPITELGPTRIDTEHRDKLLPTHATERTQPLYTGVPEQLSHPEYRPRCKQVGTNMEAWDEAYSTVADALPRLTCITFDFMNAQCGCGCTLGIVRYMGRCGPTLSDNWTVTAAHHKGKFEFVIPGETRKLRAWPQGQV